MPTDVTSSQVYKQNPGFVSRNIAGELVLIPVQKELRKVNCIYSMNPIGAQIWELLDGAKPISEIRDAIAKQYDVEASQLEQDLEEIIGQLLEIKAIVQA